MDRPKPKRIYWHSAGEFRTDDPELADAWKKHGWAITRVAVYSARERREWERQREAEIRREERRHFCEATLRANGLLQDAPATTANASPVGTLIEQRDKAERERDKAERERDEAIAFLRRTAMGRGAIVSSANMTPTQIAVARAAGRMLVTHDGCGYVYVPEPGGEL